MDLEKVRKLQDEIVDMMDGVDPCGKDYETYLERLGKLAEMEISQMTVEGDDRKNERDNKTKRYVDIVGKSASIGVLAWWVKRALKVDAEGYQSGTSKTLGSKLINILLK